MQNNKLLLADVQLQQHCLLFPYKTTWKEVWENQAKMSNTSKIKHF